MPSKMKNKKTISRNNTNFTVKLNNYNSKKFVIKAKQNKEKNLTTVLYYTIQYVQSLTVIRTEYIIF